MRESRAEHKVDSDPVVALMKFGAAQNMADLCQHGRLYMRPIRGFRELEADSLRGDPHEGLAYCGQPDAMRLEVKQGGTWLPVGGIIGPVLLHDELSEDGNLFCMFALRESHADMCSEGGSEQLVRVDDLQFGDTVVVVTDGDEFLRRVESAAKEEGLEVERGLIEYVDESSYTGAMGPFRKFSCFAYQSEFRILTKPGLSTPRVLEVGPLGDIAQLFPLSEINARLRLRRVQALV